MRGRANQVEDDRAERDVVDVGAGGGELLGEQRGKFGDPEEGVQQGDRVLLRHRQRAGRGGRVRLVPEDLVEPVLVDREAQLAGDEREQSLGPGRDGNGRDLGRLAGRVDRDEAEGGGRQGRGSDEVARGAGSPARTHQLTSVEAADEPEASELTEALARSGAGTDGYEMATGDDEAATRGFLPTKTVWQAAGEREGRRVARSAPKPKRVEGCEGRRRRCATGSKRTRGRGEEREGWRRATMSDVARTSRRRGRGRGGRAGGQARLATYLDLVAGRREPVTNAFGGHRAGGWDVGVWVGMVGGLV